MTRCAILLSHPIQYLVPLFQALSEHKGISTEVWCNNDFGNRPFFDHDFNKIIQWDIDVVEGYKRRLLKNISPRPSTSFFGQINPGIISLLLSPNRPDIILIWGWNSISHLLAIFTAKIMGVKLYLRAETTLDYENRLPYIKRKVKKFLLPVFFKLFDGFLYLGKQNLSFYHYMGVRADNLYFMPYCVTRFSKKLTIRKLKNIRRFLFVGKLSFKKRPDIVMQAFATLCRELPKLDITLTIVGDGEMRPHVKTICEQNDAIQFYGFANQLELKDIYQEHDAIILPSDERETWGLVVNEALQNGLAAITSDRVGCRSDLIEVGKNGVIFDYGDANSLTKCMRQLVEGYLCSDQIQETNLKLGKVYNHDVGAATFLELCNE